MLQITIPSSEKWDEVKQEFVNTEGRTLQLEHSLVSISKWEAKWHKPFLANQEKTIEETQDYVRCMTLTQNVDPQVYCNLTNANIQTINQYIQDSMTATWFQKNYGGRGTVRETVTSELIYYWMITLNIPFECQKWHLNRLLTLIRVCNVKNSPRKKMSRKQLLSENRALNEARRKRLNTKG